MRLINTDWYKVALNPCNRYYLFHRDKDDNQVSLTICLKLVYFKTKGMNLTSSYHGDCRQSSVKEHVPPGFSCMNVMALLSVFWVPSPVFMVM